VIVQFSEKILFLTNTDFVDKTTIQGDVDRYVITLQSVGNSLLVQANELRERLAHRKKQEKAARVSNSLSNGRSRRAPQRSIGYHRNDPERTRQGKRRKDPGGHQENGNSNRLVQCWSSGLDGAD